MKKITNVAAALIMMVSVTSCGPTRVGVKVRPATPVVIVRPVAPGPRHIWVDGNWVWSSRGYVWKQGYWMEPRRGYKWAPGYWKKQRGNWYWVEGHWRR